MLLPIGFPDGTLGSDVLVVEQFELGHEHGGSQDVSRIIRLAYHHENYTRLLPHAYKAWTIIEEDSTMQLFTKTGAIDFALRDSPFQRSIQTYADAMNAVGIAYERLDGEEVMRRYPQFHFEQDVDAVYQADTGILHAANANATHVAMARSNGATIRDHCAVQAIRPCDGGAIVETLDNTYSCRKLIITAGAWTDQVLASVGTNLSLTVTQEQVTYFATPNLREFAIGRFPFFQWHGDEFFYAFPIFGVMATKIGIDRAGPIVTPGTRTYEPDLEQERRVTAWLQQYVPGFLGPKMFTKTCLYDMPRDRNFVIDSLPHHPQILVCAGAGHAFKFAALLGKTLSQLAIDDMTEYPIEPFSIQRDAITDPDFEPHFRL